VRGTTPLSKPEHTEALIEGLVAAVSSWDSGKVDEGSASHEPTARTSDP
jgi:hypothetical protein